MQVRMKVMNGHGHSPIVEDIDDTIESLERAFAAVPRGANVFDAESSEQIGRRGISPEDKVEGWDPREHPDVVIVPAIAGG